MNRLHILEVSRYISVGVALNVSAVASFAFLMQLYGNFFHYLVLHFLNSAVWTIISFFAHKKYSFQAKETSRDLDYRNLLRFSLTAIINYLVSAIGMFILVDFAYFTPEMSRVLTAILLLPGVFLLNKLWVYT